MNFSHHFVGRPVFASVLSVLILVLGGIGMFNLPVSEYPEVVPPSVVVRATYPGANAQTIAATVATPLEQALNGIENALYMTSQAASDGVLSTTITFQVGTDIDTAQVQVQNRVAQALPKLPEEVRRLGIVTTKQSPDLTMVVHLIATDERYDEKYLRNFASLQVKDELARLPGVGSVEVFGTGEFAMRVWVDPDRLAARGLTASDVVAAIREQNTQVAAGAIGKPPGNAGTPFETQIGTRGRLVEEEEFADILVKVGEDGQELRLGDVARVELGAADYNLRSLLDNRVAVALPIFQAPGANAIRLSDDVRETLARLQVKFPRGIEYRIVYDPTTFVRDSIHAVVETLLEAIVLVVIVVIVFLQTWRASIIPLVAVPVSLIGTFAAMYAFGFSINALSLFGLVLAIGIVVDDAIVVVENVERNIELGLSPVDATRQAMTEVTGPIVATALVLCAVFVPTAFISGLTGRFYVQFAITIAVSTVISAFNSLTLSPALSALLLRGHGSRRDWLTRGMDRAFGWFFRGFDRAFRWSGDAYASVLGGVVRKTLIMLLLYVGLVFATGAMFRVVPTGFVPTQDKQFLVAFAQLPEAASIERTERVVRRMCEIALAHPGVEHAVAFPGMSVNGFAAAPNSGIIFFGLTDFADRRTPDLAGPAIAASLTGQFGEITEAVAMALPPPPVMGLGMLGGFKLYVEDRADLGYDALYRNTQAVIGRAWQRPATLANVFSTFTVNVPQLQLVVDRAKAKTMGVPLQSLFETLQIDLGSLYVNDFNRFGKTYQVIVQAEAGARDDPEDITNLQVRNDQGGMVPLGSLVTVEESHGPDRVIRYNGVPAAEISGGPAAGKSSSEAEEAIADLTRETLPSGMAFEWTDLTYQRILAGNSAVYVYPLCILLVFLVLAAQYESLRLPLAILLIVPLCLLFALVGVWLTDADNNVFTQIGLIVLIGLACKNSILIVQFAKVKQDEGDAPADAAVAAARLRLRPILMTSIAFIAGVYPLASSTGAGAEMRRAMGVAVFSGMIGVTLLGLFLTPVFYSVLMRRRRRRAASAPAAGSATVAPAGLLLLAGLMLTSCVHPPGPDYQRPAVAMPAAFRDQPAGPWKQGEPRAELPRGAWWRLFADSELDALQARAATNNQDLAAAAARVEQARATLAGARGGLLPSLSTEPSLTRSRSSENVTFRFPQVHSTSWRLPLDLDYELDLFGRLRRGLEARERASEVVLADFEAMRLSLHGEVARVYFAVRAADAELSSLRRALRLRREATDLARLRVEAGTGTDLDVARSETEAAATAAEVAATERARSELANALAVLVGEAASDFTLAAADALPAAPPVVPAGLPSELLERRPDVAAAERQVAVANARIGVAQAAFFPVFSLTGFGGFESHDLSSLFDWSSRIWSLGPSLYLPIFQGGKLRADLQGAEAAFAEAVALYRQRILIACREVQDALTAARLLAEEAAAHAEALASAQRAAGLARTRFDAGLVAYLDVLDAERVALDLEQRQAQIRGERLRVSVQLVLALGGGWSAAELPPLGSGEGSR